MKPSPCCGIDRLWGLSPLAGVLMIGLTARLPADDSELGVTVPPGFEVTLYADDHLAHDIYSMTTDRLGRVVVSGVGYVRILEDTDNDGRADIATPFVDGPASGAQGMYFYGPDLLCTGDGGLIRYRDRDGDDRADGPPEVFLKARTGGEHDIHAIRLGPDGWWYLIAGNMAGIDKSYVTLPHSPVRAPQAGSILRLQPDLAGAEVLANGYRNAYDFDFHTAGDVFTFDSDGERDITLPWYRPVRVFQAIAGSHAGWWSRSWKRPDTFPDMPPVVASFGRGSPTGVECYRHTQFPEKYRNAMFVLDWTYGRVMALPLAPSGSVWASKPVEFMSSVGQFGFAPTDATVGPDGSLFVSVGGRGTRGGVYRIRWKSQGDETQAGQGNLERCLTAPQPLSSWSRAEWEPLARELGADAFMDAARSSTRPAEQRVRAIEILTDKFDGPSSDLLLALSLSREDAVRARAAWSLGRTPSLWGEADVISRFLQDRDARVLRATLETLLMVDDDVVNQQPQMLARLLGHPDRFVRQAAVRVMSRMSAAAYQETARAALPFGWQAAASVAQAYSLRHPGYAPYTIDIGTRILKGRHAPDLKYEAARLLQLGLGDLFPESGVDPVFEGYASRIDLKPQERDLDPLRIALAEVYPTGQHEVDLELARVLAMVQPVNPDVLDSVLSRITPDSHPTDDVHHLIVAARVPIERSAVQRARIADALVRLEFKILDRGLKRDSNWEDRLIEMYISHIELDAALPQAILEHPELGHPGHVIWVLALDDNQREQAVRKFVGQIKLNPEYAWSADVVFLLGESTDESVRDLLREQFHNFSLQNAILLNLADRPVNQDRPLFIQGLESQDLGVLAACLESLKALGVDNSAGEQVALLRTARRLGESAEERSLRDQALGLLERNSSRAVESTDSDSKSQDELLSQWTQWVEQNHPDEWKRQTGVSSGDLNDFHSRLADVDWDAGDAARGHQLFRSRSCDQCHGSAKALGPDLAGVTNRFSRSDLFTAIALPNRDVSPRYQTTLVATVDGSVHTGLIVYESVDGLVLRTGANQTLRFSASDIEMQRVLPVSLMPAGLLKDLEGEDLADLYAYLRTLGLQTAEAGNPGRSE